jgi:hypothetical protein
LFKLLHILTTYRIKHVLYDGINFQFDKSLDFVELMLKSCIFFIEKVVILRTIKWFFLTTKLHSKGLERSVGDMGAEKRHFMFLIGFWHSKWNYVIQELSYILVIFFGLYLNMTFKICSIDLNHALQHLVVEKLNIHIPFSLFNISKHSFCFKIHDIGQKGVMVLIVVPQQWMQLEINLANQLQVFFWGIQVD